jgi:4-hydroxy-2-oxoglutarate aldolase
MQALVRENRVDEARALQQRLMPIARSVGATFGVAGLKAALDLIGYSGGVPRPPLRPAPQSVVETIASHLAELDETETGFSFAHRAGQGNRV